MSRVALALHGYFNNGVDPESGDNGFKYIQETLLNKYNVDVFIHSWEPQKEAYITALYNPIYSTFESQIDFSTVMKENNIFQEYFDYGFNREHSPYANCSIKSTLSFLYSRNRALNLVRLYENKKKFKYDAVITARFDLGQRDKFGKWKYYVSQMNFDLENDMNFVYSAMFDQLNAGYADQWFYSNSDNMQTLGKAYEKALNYFQIDSSYEQVVTQGWPDSVQYDGGFYDPNQFTNEKFKSIKSSLPLMKYPRWQCINNHILYKWFFIDTGMYNKSRFV